MFVRIARPIFGQSAPFQAVSGEGFAGPFFAHRPQYSQEVGMPTLTIDAEPAALSVDAEGAAYGVTPEAAK